MSSLVKWHALWFVLGSTMVLMVLRPCCIWERLLPLSASARTRRWAAAHPLWHRAERTAADSLADPRTHHVQRKPDRFDLVVLRHHRPHLWGKLVGLCWSDFGHHPGDHGGQSAGSPARNRRNAGIRRRAGNPVGAGGVAGRPRKHVPAPPSALHHLSFVPCQRDPHFRRDLSPLRFV